MGKQWEDRQHAKFKVSLAYTCTLPEMAARHTHLWSSSTLRFCPRVRPPSPGSAGSGGHTVSCRQLSSRWQLTQSTGRQELCSSRGGCTTQPHLPRPMPPAQGGTSIAAASSGCPPCWPHQVEVVQRHPLIHAAVDCGGMQAHLKACCECPAAGCMNARAPTGTAAASKHRR